MLCHNWQLLVLHDTTICHFSGSIPMYSDLVRDSTFENYHPSPQQSAKHIFGPLKNVCIYSLIYP